MKKPFFSFLTLLALLFSVSSLNLSQENSKATFEKIYFVEIDIKTDSSLFIPYSKAWSDSWRYVDADLYCGGSEAMNAANYQFAFNGRTENLFTLIHPKLINGELTIYSPYDPQMMGLSGFDDGELRYPVKGSNPVDNFLNSQELRDELCYYFGQFGSQSSMPLLNQYGEDSTLVMPDGTVSYVYPPRDYIWYRDSDIIKYRVRINVIVDKNGKEKKRTIESFAPVTYELDEGQIIGERELFWVDYNEAKMLLADGYFFGANGKPVTYLKYIEEKMNSAKL